MSTSRHPVAYRLEELIGGQTKLLATVMALPLVDGIFAALVVADALNSPLRIVETGLLIFGGSATAAVILAEMDGTPREHAKSVLAVGAIIVPLAAAEAAVAPIIANLVDLVIFERFAALVILAIAAKTASSQVGEWLPSPGAIIALGLVASLQVSDLSMVFQPDPGAIQPDPTVMASAAASAGVGVAFALGVAVGGPRLRGRVDLDRFRFGSSVALGMLAVSVLGFAGVPTDQPIALYVLLVTAVLSYDTDGVADDAAAAEESVAETPRPQAGGVASEEPAVAGDAPGHGIDTADESASGTGDGSATSGTPAADSHAAGASDGAVNGRSDEARADESDAGDKSDADHESAGDDETNGDDEPQVDADDEPRQADEEYGQSRAPWL